MGSSLISCWLGRFRMAVGNPIITDSKKSQTMKVALGMFLVVVATVAIVAVSMHQQPELEELAAKKGAKKAAPLTFGSSITLMTAYNEYIIVTKSGKVYMDGFLNGNDVIKIMTATWCASATTKATSTASTVRRVSTWARTVTTVRTTFFR